MRCGACFLIRSLVYHHRSTLMSPQSYSAILDVGLKIAADFKAQLTSKYRAPVASWLARTALEDVGGIEEFFSIARNVSSQAGAGRGLSFSSHADVRLFEICTMFRLPPSSTLESKLLAVLCILCFHQPFANTICQHDMRLFPAVVKEYPFWSADVHVAKVIVRIFARVAKSAGQLCIDELSNAGSLHLLCKAITVDNGAHALKVRVVTFFHVRAA